MVSEVLELKIERLARLENGSKVKAFCDLLFGNLFLVKGFRVVEGDSGLFVGMPQQKSQQGKWFDLFTPATNEVREYITDFVLNAYKEKEEE